ncbi:MAG: Kiwa anti-phage protein KwaB-like domain-containing protein [Coriobacteriales bacterium]
MLSEYKEIKDALVEALDAVDADLHHHVSSYAVLDTQDPAWPFEIRSLCRQGQETDSEKLINERLFDRAFLDYGFREVLDENALEGVVYQPVEDLFKHPDGIGCAPWDHFIEDPTKARMAHGVEEDDDKDDLDAMRFPLFLKSVQGNVIDGQPGLGVKGEDVERVRGLLFKYVGTLENGNPVCVVAFQRVQPMWIQQTSSLLLFHPDAEGPEAFASRSLKIGTSFDFVIFNSQICFRNLRALEILFHYNKFAAAKAKSYVESFDELLADTEKLEERIDDSRSVANKLLKMQKEGSPVAKLSPEELRARVSRIAYYSRKISFNEQGLVMLTTDTNVNDFLKLLNDTFLVSQLTGEEYEAKSKTRLESDEI